MRAVVCLNAELEVVDLPEPEPAAGQVRLTVERCGICGSDLHARHGIDAWADMAAQTGYDRFGRSTHPLGSGPESPATAAEPGPACRADVPSGAPVVALPLIRGPEGPDAVGLSPHAPGGYAEQVVVQEAMMMAVR